jgi:hypothetical protein
LTVNPEKTRLVAFTRRKLPGFFEQCIFGMILRRSISVKYLGVILDSRLTWREQVDINARKAHKLLWACKRACGVRWDLRPWVVHWLNVSIVRPSITFASLVWWPGFQTGKAKKQLSTVQRLACLGITGAMRTASTNAVEALICLPPQELVIQREARSAAQRLWSLRSWSYVHRTRG